jgi:hypothetical protein
MAFEVQNLDAFTYPEELDEIANNPESPVRIREYAREKAQAMRLRIAGDIVTAVRHENNCDRIYQDLSDDEIW